MNNRKLRNGTVVLTVSAMILIALPGVAQDTETTHLDVVNLVEQVLSTAPSVINSRRTVDQAYAGYQLALAQTRPDVTVRVNPYTLNTRRVVQGATAEDQVIHTVGAGIEVQQALPTNGVVQGALGANLSVTRGDAESSQFVPEFSVIVSQPLFAGDSMIDTKLFQASRRSEEVKYRQAIVTSEIQRNQVVRSAIDLFVRVASLERSLGVLERTVDVLTRQLEDARINLQQGLISDTNVLALQVTLNTQRENLLNLELSAVEARQALARTIGLERPPDNWELVDEFGEGDFSSLLEDARNAGIDENRQVVLGRLGVVKADSDVIGNDRIERPQLTVTATASPAYPAGTRSSVSAAFGDYFEGGTGVDSVLAVELQIPLLTRQERAYRERIDAAVRDIAVTNLNDTRREAGNNLQTLELNRRFLTERVELALTDVEYEAQRLENERALLEVGASTELAVDQVGLDVASRQNELWQLRAELYLNSLDILMAAGIDLASALGVDEG